jgi:DNA-binding transcriptional MerR regulator/effector-binding domain-containing protein
MEVNIVFYNISSQANSAVTFFDPREIKKNKIPVDSPPRVALIFKGKINLRRQLQGNQGAAMYSIGEFSRICGLSIKALRLYHEKGLLVPSVVDETTGYRYYDHKNAEQARIIAHLRAMEFSLEDIGAMLSETDDDTDVVDFFETQADAILEKIRKQKDIVKTLQFIIKTEKENKMTMQNPEFEIEEKDLETLLIAGVRFKGKYSDCGDAFGKIGKAMGMNICGKALCLYYDSDYKENDADIEACMPVRKGKSTDAVSVRELAGGRCVSLIHKGPYDTLSRSYEKITSFIKKKGYTVKQPSREVYLKGPGMIFKGKPENFLTEIQMMVEK